jgi:hypothetical protein
VSTVASASLSPSSERGKKLRLKRIVVSEDNHLALKRLGQARDSFNDMVSKLLRTYGVYQAKVQQQRQRQQHNTHGQTYSIIRGELPFRANISASFDQQER